MVSLIIVIVYLALLFGVCGWAQVKQKKQAAAGGKVSFLMAGKNLPMLLVVMLMMGNLIGGTNTTGLAQLAMGGGGMAAVTYGLAGVVGILFLGIVGARRMRQMNYSTTAEMMADYNGSASRYLMVIGQLIICGGVGCLRLSRDGHRQDAHHSALHHSGVLPRDDLYDVFPASAEKAHHGHHAGGRLRLLLRVALHPRCQGGVPDTDLRRMAPLRRGVLPLLPLRQGADHNPRSAQGAPIKRPIPSLLFP